MRSLAALVSAASTSEPSGFAAVEPKRLSREDVIGDYRLYYRAFPVYFGSLESSIYLFNAHLIPKTVSHFSGCTPIRFIATAPPEIRKGFSENAMRRLPY
jgi:hypothetical protein